MNEIKIKNEFLETNIKKEKISKMLKNIESTVEAYKNKVNYILKYLKFRINEENAYNEKSKEILKSVVNYLYSAEFLENTSFPEKYDYMDGKMNIKIKIESTELIKYGIDFNKPIFDIIKTIENQINEEKPS
ncbi:hypothetical protein ACDQ58_07220 [Fusobacterium animalis]|uniref:hypothetical protein n=1 Tax=Fusobacterium animalis TaxID=76859 RepID=UPI003555DA90